MIRRRPWPLLAFVAAAIAVGVALHTAREEELALTHFFDEVDRNRDGQVDEDEAKRYIGQRIGGHEYDTAGEVTEAFRHMVKNIDTDDVDSKHLISVNEVQQHLHTLQQAVSVKEWVQHGLGLPQYGERFRQNRITAEDFPLLVNDDGKIFEEELQITSRLHRNQITRGMKRLILGLGELPSTPQVIACRALSEMQTELHWAAPVNLGDPPVHKYVIESRDEETNGAPWILAAEIEAYTSQGQYKHVVEHPAKGHQFRIAAWTAYGPSQPAPFDLCQPLQRISASSNALAELKYQQVSQKQSFAEIASSKAKEEKPESERTAFWSLFVIAVMIALRVLTRRNIAMLKCCVLYQLERLTLFVGWKSLARKIHAIKRVECPCCKARSGKSRELNQTKEKPPAMLTRTKAFSHKIEPEQHFGLDESRMVFSQSSHALGDHRANYNLTAWNTKEAKEAVDSLPVPDYPLSAWEKTESMPSTSSSIVSDVQSQLIEGQCAHEGCLREWNGMFQFRNRWSRHFCSICLRTYCYEHTRISPHGAFGFCGQDSRCVCESCFAQLPPASQSRLEATNKLDKSQEKKDELERSTWMRDGSRKENRSSLRSLTGHDKQQPQPTRRTSRFQTDHET